ncbi:MAG: YceH family protein [Candidatus Acidiferrum sp.]
MNIVLSEVEARVLACLVEKEITTPEYYPLSLNALVHACNQKSNRDPLMNLDEAAVRQALRGLGEQALARSAGGDSRVAKYEHRLAEMFNFTRPETAILCELLLRGPQTPGELRSRAERMHPFEDLNVVHTTLKHLTEREPPLAALLPRQPGMKEARYAHLLSGNPDMRETEPVQPIMENAVSNGIAGTERVAQLANAVEGLQQEIADLKRQFAEFRKQFE